MSLNPSVFKAYDIRGIYPTDLDEQGIASISKGIYSFMSKKLNKRDVSIVVSRDMRLSSPSLFEAAKRALMELGATVIDIGICPTTTLYYAALKYGYDGGFQISASHNPKEYNGVKFVMAENGKILKIAKSNGMDEIKRMALENDFLPAESGGNVIEKTTAVHDAVEYAKELVNLTHIKPFKVVADVANAMGSVYLNEMYTFLPGTLVRMNFELDGTFPVHQADPLQFKLHEALQKKVVDEKADLGISVDGDGDRVYFIDEKNSGNTEE
ncbi:hypothetical protein HGB07_04535 [Candidatus Roizmanbacteria bacterium]|nr:hypothetical protein [Candidatus Roizmanbacteria bacterium]